MLSYLPVPPAQSTPIVADAGVIDPLFVVAVVGSLAFLWILVRFIVDDVDLHGDAEDLAPRMSGLPKRGGSGRSASARPSSGEWSGGTRWEADVHPLTPRVPSEDPSRPNEPRRPDRRRRPAA